MVIVLTQNGMNVYRITDADIDGKDIITFINGERIWLGTYNDPIVVLKKLLRSKDSFIMPPNI